MSSISAGTTNSTGLVATSDTTGSLLLKTGASATTALTIDASQNVTFAAGVSTTGNQTVTGNLTTTGYVSAPNTFDFKNRIINGNMVIDQRNGGASVNTDNSYPVDRFKMSLSGSATATAQRSTTAPTGFVNSILYTVGTGAAQGTTSTYRIFQVIEGFNTSDLMWGSATAQTVMLSFWVRSSVTGTFSGGAIEANGGTASYTFTYSISVANTWEYKTVTIAGPTIGTWQTGSSASINITFDMGSGTNYEQAAGSWTSSANKFRTSGSVVLSATSAATFYITGVQLEKGTVATSFDFRDYGRELLMCQRYLPSFYGSSSYSPVGIGQGASATLVDVFISFPVQARVAVTGVAGASITTPGNFAHSQNANAVTGVTFYGGSVSGVVLRLTSSGITTNAATIVYLNTALGLFYFTGAEL